MPCQDGEACHKGDTQGHRQDDGRSREGRPDALEEGLALCRTDPRNASATIGNRGVGGYEMLQRALWSVADRQRALDEQAIEVFEGRPIIAPQLLKKRPQRVVAGEIRPHRQVSRTREAGAYVRRRPP